MAFRLLRIVSSPEMFQQRLSELKTDYLIPRDYKSKVIEDVFEKVRKITREEALAKKKWPLLRVTEVNNGMTYAQAFPNMHHRSVA